MAIIDVVKYNGSPDVFAWKYPSEELCTWTQLIVNESQEAILYKGGQALDLFGAGRHVLETANIPILNKIVNLPFGGMSPFAAEVWYVNKLHSLDVKWGTASPIQLQDPKYKIFIPLRAFGQFGIQISESRTFLTKLVGTLPVFDKNNILKYFRGVYLTKVKDAIASYLIKKSISAMEINAYLDELSEFLKESMTSTLGEYGINLLNFYVNDINIPEDDSAVKQLKAALAKRAEMDIVGYSYTQERSFDTLEGAATNPGSMQSGLMGAGMGLGMGFGVGGAMGGQMGGLASQIDVGEQNSSSQPCPKCGVNVTGKPKFCPECGAELVRRCEKCGAPIEGNPKFCPECGSSLIKKCPACGVAIEGKPKFCPDCGEKL